MCVVVGGSWPGSRSGVAFLKKGAPVDLGYPGFVHEAHHHRLYRLSAANGHCSMFWLPCVRAASPGCCTTSCCSTCAEPFYMC